MGGRKKLIPSRRSVEERNELVLKHKGLVSYIVDQKIRAKTALSTFGREDAIQVGYIALMRCAEIWNEKEGSGFVGYAFSGVYRAIMREILTNKTIRVPAYTVESPDAVVHRQVNKVNKILSIAGSSSSFRRFLYNLDVSIDLAKNNRVSLSPLPESNEIEALHTALNALPSHVKDLIIRLVGGTDECRKPASYRSIAKERGVCHETVRTEHLRWLRVLKVIILALREISDEYS